MNEVIKKEDFLRKFSESKFSYQPKSIGLAKSVLAALSMAAFSASIPAMEVSASESLEQTSSIHQRGENRNDFVGSQYSPGESPKGLDFASFLEISAEKRSGLYQHPYNKDQTVMLMMLGDVAPLERISADYEMLKGEKIPDIAVELIKERLVLNSIFVDSPVTEGKNLSHVVSPPTAPDLNFVMMDSVSATLYSDPLENNEVGENDYFFYYVLAHELGHTLEAQKKGVLATMLETFIKHDQTGLESSADFTGLVVTSQSLSDYGVKPSELAGFIGKVEGLRTRLLDDAAKAGNDHDYYGKIMAGLVEKMIKENPEKLMSLNFDEIEDMGKMIQDVSSSYDFSADFIAGIDINTEELKGLRGDLQKFRDIATDNPSGFDNAAKSNLHELNDYMRTAEPLNAESLGLTKFLAEEIGGKKSELKGLSDLELDELLKQMVFEFEMGSSSALKLENVSDATRMISGMDQFTVFENEMLADFSDKGLWFKGNPMEPEFEFGGIENKGIGGLNTVALERMLDSVVESKSFYWEPEIERKPKFLSASNQDILEKAKQYSLDINVNESVGRVDLFFKDDSSYSLRLNGDDNSSLIEELKHERVDNIKTLQNAGSEQIKGDELNRSYSAYKNNEVVIKEIDYSLSFSDSIPFDSSRELPKDDLNLKYSNPVRR